MDYVTEYKNILCENEYGFLPDKPISVKGVGRGNCINFSRDGAKKEIIDLKK